MSATAEKLNGRATRNPLAPTAAAATVPEQSAVPATLAEALSRFQGQVPPFPKSKEANADSYGYRYADLGVILPVVGPLLAECGLSWSAKPRADESGTMWLTYRLLHVSGEFDDGEIPLGVRLGCKPQELGSALTYMRRYAMSAQLGLATEEDDDGQQAQQAPRSTVQPASAGPQPTASAPKGGERPASAQQKKMLHAIIGEASKAEIPAGTVANALLQATGESVREWESDESAGRWLDRAIDRMPAKLVTAVKDALGGLAENSVPF